MAKNDPAWDLGQGVLYTSSGATVANGDTDWDLGQGVLEHEFLAVVSGRALKKNNSGSGVLVHLKKNNAGSGDEIVLKYNNAGTGVAVNTSGS